MRDGALDEVLEKRLSHDIEVEGVIGFFIAGLGGTDGDVLDSLVGIHVEDLDVLEGRQFAVLVSDGDVRFLFGVEVEHILEIEIVDRVGVGDDDILVAGFPQEVEVAVQGVEPVVPAGCDRRRGVVRRQEVQTFTFAGKVPGFAGTDVVHQGLIVLFRDDADFGDARVDHIGQGEVDETIAASEGDGGHRPHGREFPDGGIVGLRMDDTKHIICSHSSCPPLHSH